MPGAFPKLDALENAARSKGRLTVAVAYPCSKDSLSAAVAAQRAGLIEPVLVGPRANIERCAHDGEVTIDHMRIADTPDDGLAASRAAVALVNAGEAEALMKGSQHTHDLMSAIVARDANMRTERRISHAFWFDLPAYEKPLIIADAVVNIAPDLNTKADILRNAVEMAQAVGIPRPKVALLSSVETVNPAIASSVDSDALAKMAKRGEITGAIVDGPFAFDNAISKIAAITKGIASPVAGHADILMVPSLDVGNALYKSFVYMGGGECAGIILGARVPIILTSRADSERARVASCALALLHARRERA